MHSASTNTPSVLRARSSQFARPDRQARLERLHRLSRLMDESIRVPGTNFRFGIDSLIGLIPGLGDLAGAMISLYLVHEARRLGVSKLTMLRMAANVGIDLAVGALPLVGDLADFAFKANRRNVRLLENHLRRRP